MVALRASLLRTPGTQALRAQINRQTGLAPRRPLANTIRADATDSDVGKYLALYQGVKALFYECGSNINDYCSIDISGAKPVSQMTLGEKEQAFLEAMSAYYIGGKPEISDAEFDLLKDELLWNGSKVAVLTANEQKFLEAVLSFNKGKPVMSNDDFDLLKIQLKKENSMVTAAGPRCSIRSRKMYSDASVDYLRLVALNIPAAITVLLGLFSIDDLTGFEVTKLIELPEPFGIVFVWGFVLPAVYILSNAITGLVFKDALVLKAECPSCGTESFSYFGDILTVSGSRVTNTVECANCKAKLVFDADKRSVEVAPSETATA